MGGSEGRGGGVINESEGGMWREGGKQEKREGRWMVWR